MVVYLSEASLHSIIHSSCPALERLLIVLGIEIGISCLQIKSPHLKSIGICFEGQQLIIEDAPSLQRLLLDNCYKPSQITVISAPKLETLGVIRDPFNRQGVGVWLLTFSGTVYYHLHICNHMLHFSFVRISFISSWSTLWVLILCYMLNEEFVHL